MNGLLKFITCGSVDDGKSTLIGHILYDAKLIYTDQEKALELDSKVGSREGKIDYSLLLDGLMAEREQGITIDVAYRYFTTEHRSFIVADTPGHEEYTRNMAVGASFAQLAIILIDAKQGVLTQTRRHARICSLMGIRNFVFAINKMDLVDYDKDCYDKIVVEIKELEEELTVPTSVIIPLSATEGDNITNKSPNMSWYQGEALLPYLETVDVTEDKSEEGFYMPVQRVCRPNHSFRGFQGQIESGSIAVGDEIIAVPSNEKANVKSILVTTKEEQRGYKGQPVTIQLDREVDVSRGCVLTKDTSITPSKQLRVKLLWMDDDVLAVGKEYIVKLGTKKLPGVITSIEYKIDINSGNHMNTDHLEKNEIALCTILLSEKSVVDLFLVHKTLGEFILIDRVSNMTAACGTVEELVTKEEPTGKTSFHYKGLTGYGDLFDEFYYNLKQQVIQKSKIETKDYTVSDVLPLRGESYQYPDYVDILLLKEQIAVKIRAGVLVKMIPMEEFEYEGYPMINESGFAIHVNSSEEFKQFYQEYRERNEKDEILLFDKWVEFGMYRNVVFHNNFWMI